MKEHNVQLRELAERFRRRGCTATAILIEADAWIAEHPEDDTFRYGSHSLWPNFRVPKAERA